MTITAEIKDYSDPDKPCITVHNSKNLSKCVELGVDGEWYTVNARELISAIERCMVSSWTY